MRKILVFFGLFFSLSIFGQTYAPDSVFHFSTLLGAERITVGKIILKGNKITKDKIILRELEFNEGDVLSKEDFEQKLILSRQNLMNRSLFNFVTFTPKANGNVYDVEIEVVERWYIWPIPVVEYADRNINVWWETKDFSRLNYGLDLRIENFRGRMEFLNFIVKRGYDKTLTLVWDIPYLNKKQTWGMSVIGGGIFNHETVVNTIANKLQYYKVTDGFAKKWYFSEVDVLFRPKYRILHTFSVIYNNLTFKDSILLLNPEFTYGKTKYNYLSLKYLFKLDNRDYKPYPLVGYYFDVSLTKTGLGLFSDVVNIVTVQSAFDQYVHLHKRWYFAYNVSVRISPQLHLPYFLSSGLGLGGMDIRGYELYMVNGQNLGLLRSNLKFEILPQKTFEIPWIKTEKFGKIFFALYANLFFDGAFVSDVHTAPTNPLANQFLWATGVGVDLVTYYDVVVRMEYAINKQKKTGFYLSLVAPI